MFSFSHLLFTSTHDMDIFLTIKLVDGSRGWPLLYCLKVVCMVVLDQIETLVFKFIAFTLKPKPSRACLLWSQKKFHDVSQTQWNPKLSNSRFPSTSQ